MLENISCYGKNNSMRRQLRRREEVCRTARTCVSLNPKLQWLLCFALSNYRSLLRDLHCAPPNRCVARRCVKLQRWTLKYCIAQVPTPHLEALRNARCVMCSMFECERLEESEPLQVCKYQTSKNLVLFEARADMTWWTC